MIRLCKRVPNACMRRAKLSLKVRSCDVWDLRACSRPRRAWHVVALRSLRNIIIDRVASHLFRYLPCLFGLGTRRYTSVILASQPTETAFAPLGSPESVKHLDPA